MSIQGLSFYQQNQQYWQQAKAQSQAADAHNALVNVMGNAMVNLSKGLSAIANGTALKRVNSQLVSAVQDVLQPGSSSSSNSSSGSSASSSSSSAPAKATPATAVGTVPLTASTSLATLGILPGGRISISSGINTTTYTSTGTDTVANLINALNINLPTNADIVASINTKGRLTITSRNTTNMIVVDGSGTDAAAIGFSVGHTTFKPTKPTSSSGSSSASGSSSSSSSSSSSGSSSSSTSKTAAKTTTPTNTALALQSFKTAASILSASGVSGNLVNMLS